VSVSKLAVPRKPNSTETRVTVSGSGASSTVMKSYAPSRAYWDSTFAPSASTSLFTALIQSGLFLRVFTPSGLKRLNMMYVPIALMTSSQ
jgi:hypothetical protein